MNKVASEHFFHRARATRTIEEIWERLQQASTWARIGGVSRITDERFDENGDLVAYRFIVVVAGAEYHGSAQRKSFRRHQRMVMAIDSKQLTGEIAIDLVPVDEGTWVETSLSMFSRGFTSAMLFPVLVKAVAGGFDEAAAGFVDSLG